MNKNDLETLSVLRIKEAEILLNAECYQGAYYLAGYALECALKACITKQVKQYDFPDRKLSLDSYTHDLSKLLITAGLKQKLIQKEIQDINFKLNWSVANKWSEETRYDHSIQKQDAFDLFEAITENQSGVLPWLKSYL
ncbi:HEPN domain-containing protein [Methylomonas koyamae]|uniref:DNA-binding protein n=1 Tax=Methylomonas koyamae TaxID=702114 RepID=A0A291IKN3_9GAMM|nr:HEPN domain-containing protein [Methylomonas koyamae]ATG90758.1 DNA-binding protein [Methylomonas koyamae]OAI22179.1 DNA-binding protein [Methylomonas koyamae]